jgi:hypothetical protein
VGLSINSSPMKLTRVVLVTGWSISFISYMNPLLFHPEIWWYTSEQAFLDAPVIRVTAVRINFWNNSKASSHLLLPQWPIVERIMRMSGIMNICHKLKGVRKLVILSSWYNYSWYSEFFVWSIGCYACCWGPCYKRGRGI